jgi:alkanesulfonate monooxygenase SsuD/methylene tetrahydromethanopterin reductase-like flavin-dependent oxidoreductase (luciferase family)
MRIGYVLPMGDDPASSASPATPAEIVALAEAVEAGGFDSVWTFDHLLAKEGDEPPVGTWEAWTVLTAIAMRTRRVDLGVLVSCTAWREPIVTAKIAHTLHELSGGRVVLGLGAGWHEPEFTAFGIPFDHKVDRFAEQLEIIGALIRDGRSDFAGKWHRTVDAPLLPPPAAGRSRPPILVGGRGPRMLGLTARHADAWNTAWYGSPGPKFTEAHEKMLAACAEVGRDPATLDVSVGVYVRADDAAADAPGLPGDAGAIRDAVAAWRETGVAEILFWTDPSTRARLDVLASAIAG